MQTLTRKSDEIIKHLTPRAVIIRCPECGSSHITTGLVTRNGVRIFCHVCATRAEVTVRREG